MRLPAARAEVKRRVVLALKIAVAAVLVGWLLRGGVLELGALRLLFEKPELLIASLAALALALALAALRWRLLLRVADVQISFGRALQLQLVGQFFNIVIPGGIGGDVVKAMYVAREVEPAKRPAIYLIGFVDRLIGVAGVVVLASGAMMLHGRAAWEVAELRGLGILIAILVGLTLGVPIVILVVLGRSREREVTGPSRLARFLGQLIGAVRLVSSHRATIAIALALAVAIHLLGMAVFAALAAAISTQDVPLVSVATVYPLGMLTTMLPISYAGIGVGHVAFERLFTLVGLSDGATAFNVYFVAQTLPGLLGVFPYLALRRVNARPTAIEQSEQ